MVPDLDDAVARDEVDRASLPNLRGAELGLEALHAQAVSHAAGARGEEAEELRRRLLAAGEVKIDRARELLRALEPRS